MENDETRKKKKNIISKSFHTNQDIHETIKENISFDFANLYTSAAETSMILSKKHNKNNQNRKYIAKNGSQGLSSNSISSSSNINKFMLKSPTKTNSVLTAEEATVKSIMKNNLPLITSNASDITVSATTSPAFEISNRKKRTKSVSFMLDESSEISVKKSKSNKSISDILPVSKKGKHTKKNEVLENNEDYNKKMKKKSKKLEKLNAADQSVGATEAFEIYIESEININKNKKNKHKQEKKIQTEKDKSDKQNLVGTKKKGRKYKLSKSNDVNKTVAKETYKKIDKKETFAVDLGNLSLGDNAHTLTNLLDEMTVANKTKKKKNKRKFQKNKQDELDALDENSDVDKKEKNDKDKWKKRKLNKKPEFRTNEVTTSVIVSNLSLKILLNYKDLLREHFSKFGIIKRIGVAEVYPTEDPKPVFTTTIYFCNEEAATSASEEDNTPFQGARMRVRRPLPPTETTLMIRCHASLDEPTLSSTFLGCGRIRSIRKVDKSKKSISSAFIEFDGPEAVERAIKLASTLRIGSKKVYASKFEIRQKKQDAVRNEDTRNEVIGKTLRE